MNRREFINLLTDSLVGRVPGSLISEKADYYRKYITERAEETGKSQEEIIDELGPPELIAHTIGDVYEAEYGVYEGSMNGVYDSYEKEGSGASQEDSGDRSFHFNMSGNGCFLIGFIAVVLFLAAAMWIVRFMAAYPLLVIAAVLIFYLWNRYNRRY